MPQTLLYKFYFGELMEFWKSKIIIKGNYHSHFEIFTHMLLYRLLHFVLHVLLYTNSPLTMFMIWSKNIQKSISLMAYIQVDSKQRRGFGNQKTVNSIDIDNTDNSFFKWAEILAKRYNNISNNII